MGQFGRFKRNCTKEEQFEMEAEDMKVSFLNKSYPLSIVEESQSKTREKDEKDVSKSKNGDKNENRNRNENESIDLKDETPNISGANY